MARIYTNENFPVAVARILRTFGHDVLTSREAGKADQRIPDEEVLAFAIEQKRILLTVNRKDFKRLHRENPRHFGIVSCTENTDWADFAAKIDAAIRSVESMKNQLVKVVRGNL